MGTQFDAQLTKLADMDDDDLSALESEIMQAFDVADQADDEASLAGLADALDTVRAEIAKRNPDAGTKDTEATPATPAPATASAESTDAGDIEPESPDDVEPEASQEASEEVPVEDQPSADEAVAVDTDTAPSIPEDTESEDDNNSNDNEDKEEEPVSEQLEVPKNRTPVTAATPASIVAAGADIPGISAGTIFKDKDSFAAAFASRVNTLNRLTGGDGEKVVIASVTTQADEDRMLHFGDPQGNAEKIEKVIAKEAIIASGGFCAPLSTRYDLFSMGVTDRPVRDSLPGFQADRGGIRFYAGPTLGDLNAAVGFWDNTKDAAYDGEDEDTWKVIGTVDCPTEAEVEVYAVTLGLKFGVISSRVFPENVTANTALAQVQYARVAEAGLLSKIKDGSTAITGTAVQYGAIRDLLLEFSRAGAYFRSKNRLDEDYPLRVYLPSFLIEMLRADAILGPPSTAKLADNFSISRAEIEAMLRAWNINITWYIDGVSPTTNLGNPYGLITGGALPAFPTSIQWALFAEGTWLYLDGGTLDLGIIRDSKLVRSNDYIQFSEGFENVAKVGGESLWVTSPIAVTGQFSHAIA